MQNPRPKPRKLTPLVRERLAQLEALDTDLRTLLKIPTPPILRKAKR